jgi:excisionase family DNA binding protein
METTPSPATSPTSVPGNDASVITGVFELALSVQELAAQLHVSAQTIYDLRSQGRGPTGFRVGRHLRFRTSEIEAWLSRLEGEDCERHPSGEAR